ncbi:MAG: hypothetical protein P1V97_21605, partial [Planctomycetota bacterium]|nr:hypothetical protein [Planctomycetota bacterium]
WFHEECWVEHGGCTTCVSPSHSPAESPSPDPVAVGVLTNPSVEPSIHNSLGYSLTTAEQRSLASKMGVIDAFKATGITAVPAFIVFMIAFMIVHFDFGIVLMTIYFPAFLVCVFIFMYSYKKKAHLQKALNEALKNKQANATPASKNGK